jgi:hypothetical protein
MMMMRMRKNTELARTELFGKTSGNTVWSVRSMVACVQSCYDGYCLERSQQSKWKVVLLLDSL